MKINGNEIIFTKEHPQEEGTFLWKTTNSVETVNVVFCPSKSKWGVKWDDYYGVSNMRMRNVTQLSGEFVKIED